MSLEEEAAKALQHERQAASRRAAQQRANDEARARQEDLLRGRTAELLALLQKKNIAQVRFRRGVAYSDSDRDIRGTDSDDRRGEECYGWIVEPWEPGTPGRGGLYGGETRGKPGKVGRALTVDGIVGLYVIRGGFSDDGSFVPYGWRRLFTHILGFGSNLSVPSLEDAELLAVATQVLAEEYPKRDLLSDFELDSALRRRMEKAAQVNNDQIRQSSREDKSL